MARCDDCNDVVQHVWRHREYGDSMTYRRLRWLCSGCHPSMSGRVVEDLSGPAVMADGGTTGCPECAGPTVNGQGLFDCVDCGWSGRK